MGGGGTACVPKTGEKFRGAWKKQKESPEQDSRKHYDETKEIIGSAVGPSVNRSVEEISVRGNDECSVVGAKFRQAQEKQNCMQAENMMCQVCVLPAYA